MKLIAEILDFFPLRDRNINLNNEKMENKMYSHRDLEIWQRSIKLVVEIYKLTKTFPEDEKYGLTNQIRRASVSVPSNIAEGACRKSNKEFINFLHISLGSLSEVETQIIISNKLKYLNEIESVLSEIKSLMFMTRALIRKLG